VCLLCSDDFLVDENQLTFDELGRLQPSTPADCRLTPSTINTSPFQVSAAAGKTAIQSFPNGSTAASDDLRTQHLKDLSLGTTDLPTTSHCYRLPPISSTFCWRARYRDRQRVESDDWRVNGE